MIYERPDVAYKRQPLCGPCQDAGNEHSNSYLVTWVDASVGTDIHAQEIGLDGQ